MSELTDWIANDPQFLGELDAEAALAKKRGDTIEPKAFRLIETFIGQAQELADSRSIDPVDLVAAVKIAVGAMQHAHKVRVDARQSDPYANLPTIVMEFPARLRVGYKPPEGVVHIDTVVVDMTVIPPCHVQDVQPRAVEPDEAEDARGS